MPDRVTITVDTNILDHEPLAHIHEVAAAAGIEIEVHTVTVNLRERGAGPEIPAVAETAVWGESQWDQSVWGGKAPTPEAFIIGETPLGSGALVSNEQGTLFEEVLRIISNGSFPKPGHREGLTGPQRNQLRDAMTLEAHTRAGRDVFISKDMKAFTKYGKREALEALCSTVIVTLAEVGVRWP